jgi:hypothetical protein
MHKVKYKKNKNTYYVRLVLPLYNISYYVFVGDTMLDTCKYFDKVFKGSFYSKDPNVYTSGAYCSKSISTEGDVYFSLLFSREFLKQNKNSLIAHEGLHLTYFIGEYLGLIFDIENHEAQTYMLQDIVNKVTKVLK